MTTTPFQLYRNFAVTDVKTIQDFLNRYYKHDRYKGRGEKYAVCLLASHTETLEEHGVDWISHHDSNTGTVVSFYL